jgi:hypothetical protein
MRLRNLGLVLTAYVVLASNGSPAHALPFTAVVTLHYTASADVPSLVVNGSGTSIDGVAGAFTLPAGSITGTDSVDPTSPSLLPVIAGLDLSVATGAGSFAPGSPFGGTMSLGGVLTQYYFARDPESGVPIPLDVVGVGGSQPYSGDFSGTITGGPWTLGTVSATDSKGTQTASGLDARTPDGLGTLRLVTAFNVTGVPVALTLGGIATLDLTFVPEPGTAILLGAGLCALAGLRRRTA